MLLGRLLAWENILKSLLMVPKICTYPRSGTHLIMATVYRNFEVGDQSKEGRSEPGRTWGSTGKKRVVIPWLKMFGTHDPFLNSGFSKDHILYGIRHPLDALISRWRMKNLRTWKSEQGPLGEFLTEDIIQEWIDHVNGYVFEGDCFWLKYEDIIGPDEIYHSLLENIQEVFSLDPKCEEWVRVIEKVSWQPKLPKPEVVPSVIIDRMKSTIPCDLMAFFGYDYKGNYANFGD